MSYLEDTEDRMRILYEGLQKIDDFYKDFRYEHEGEIIRIIREFHFDFERNELLNEMLSQYATVVLSVTTSVLDKDRTYPEYRKAEELRSMQFYFDKITKVVDNMELAESIHKKTKELLVKYNPKIFDLSTEGFRMLEIYLKLFNLDFIANYNLAVNKSL